MNDVIQKLESLWFVVKIENEKFITANKQVDGCNVCVTAYVHTDWQVSTPFSVLGENAEQVKDEYFKKFQDLWMM